MATNGQRTFTATIDRVNDRGFVTKEQPAVWFNVSRYAEPAPLIPEPGTVVEVALDGSGFVRAITPAAGTQPRIIRDPELGGVYDVPSAPQRPAAPRGDRDRTITRLAVLKAAARFACSRPDASSADVLIVAALWESWIERD